MKTAGGSLLLFVSIASVTFGSAFADSTDDALNQFYSVIGTTNLTSDVPQASAKQRPTQSAGKVHRRANVQKDNDVSDLSGQIAAANGDSLFLYHPSAAVTKKVQASFLSRVDQQPDDSSKLLVQNDASDIAAAEARFDALFYRYGFSSRNVSDTYAGYVLILWEIVNDQDASVHPTGIMQFRAQVSKTGLRQDCRTLQLQARNLSSGAPLDAGILPAY